MEKVYNLEERTAIFAERTRDLCLKLPKNIANNEYIPQLIRSSSSVGSNYIEGNECLGDKDFRMKIKTCRRESKESVYFLRLILVSDKMDDDERKLLREEGIELVKIFSAILKSHGDKG